MPQDSKGVREQLSGLSFLLQKGSEDEIQDIRIDDKFLYSLSHLALLLIF